MFPQWEQGCICQAIQSGAGTAALLRKRLAGRGVGTAILYPVPIHLQPAYTDDPPLHLPVTEAFCRNLLCLPIYPELTEEEVERVCEAMREAKFKSAWKLSKGND